MRSASEDQLGPPVSATRVAGSGKVLVPQSLASRMVHCMPSPRAKRS